jgi:hypothetical protein
MKCLKLLLLAAAMPLLGSCCWGCRVDDEPVNRPQNYRAETMTRQALEASVELAEPRAMEKSGKIYIKDNYMFVNDVNKGFHIYVYDNAGTPAEVAFLAVPGATDLAVRNSTLFINQATDLVTLAYANNAITLIKRNRNVFPQKVSPDGDVASVDEDEIVTNWIPQ